MPADALPREPFSYLDPLIGPWAVAMAPTSKRAERIRSAFQRRLIFNEWSFLQVQ
jgi:hypothetical protein